MGGAGRAAARGQGSVQVSVQRMGVQRVARAACSGGLSRLSVQWWAVSVKRMSVQRRLDVEQAVQGQENGPFRGEDCQAGVASSQSITEEYK